MPAKGNVILLPDGGQDNKGAAAAATEAAAAAADAPPASSGASRSTPPPPPAAACMKEVDHLVQEIKENLKLGHHLGQHLYQHHHHTKSMQGGPLKSPSGRLVGGHIRSRGHRASPYAVPPSSRAGGCDQSDSSSSSNNVAPGAKQQEGGNGAPSQLRRWNHRRRYPSTCKADDSDLHPSDPFAMLQELITDGSLIKEAVRRLQLGLMPKFAAVAAAAAATGGGTSDAEEDGAGRGFYDSDDECRTPPAYPDLCCEVVGGI